MAPLCSLLLVAATSGFLGRLELGKIAGENLGHEREHIELEWIGLLTCDLAGHAIPAKYRNLFAITRPVRLDRGIIRPAARVRPGPDEDRPPTPQGKPKALRA